ncbi:MAG TPA: M14 family zinc carboxypeptidase [Bacteroidales bacterium]|nr:M14 family zinc carboxypeptidase [Bacteroidales bacterium]
MKKTLIITFVISFLAAKTAGQKLKIYSDFPSGNISVERISNDTIWMHPDLRDTEGDWFYWCFAVKQAKGKSLTFVFTKPNVFTAMGQAISKDQGSTWHWINGEIEYSEAFSFTFDTDDDVRFSMGMPYVQKDFDNFIKPFLESDYVTLNSLTKTKTGKEIERLFIKPPNDNVKYKVLITARHHACEMMANYEIEGLVKEILNDNWLKNNVEFCFIPFIDKDGVENGDQGKNRKPHDQNRDYGERSIYGSTKALKEWVPQWAENKLAIAMDLHCPWIKGDYHENILVVGTENERIAEQQKLFCKILKSTNKGELKVSNKIYMPFGIDWNTSASYTAGVSFKTWASTLEGVKLPISFEFPYGTNEGQIITQQNARDFGADLAIAIKKYLKQL